MYAKRNSKVDYVSRIFEIIKFTGSHTPLSSFYEVSHRVSKFKTQMLLKLAITGVSLGSLSEEVKRTLL